MPGFRRPGQQVPRLRVRGSARSDLTNDRLMCIRRESTAGSCGAAGTSGKDISGSQAARDMLPTMDVVRFGLGMRSLRMRKGWTQDRLAGVADVSRGVISRIERGRADRVAVHTLIRVAWALDARVDIRLLWQGEGLDRLTDARHAELVERTIALLEQAGWEVAAEVTFDIRGQRGSIDVLARHRATAALLVVEVKSVVPDMQAMLSGLDRKTRLGLEIGGLRGWTATSVLRGPGPSRREDFKAPGRRARGDILGTRYLHGRSRFADGSGGPTRG